jgi:hypothetical protein
MAVEGGGGGGGICRQLDASLIYWERLNSVDSLCLDFPWNYTGMRKAVISGGLGPASNLGSREL